jgi:hypothetical protein
VLCGAVDARDVIPALHTASADQPTKRTLHDWLGRHV